MRIGIGLSITGVRRRRSAAAATPTAQPSAQAYGVAVAITFPSLATTIGVLMQYGATEDQSDVAYLSANKLPK